MGWAFDLDFSSKGNGKRTIARKFARKEELLGMIKKIIIENKNSISPSKLIKLLKMENYSHEEIQSVIHNEIDLGHIQLGTGLRLYLGEGIKDD